MTSAHQVRAMPPATLQRLTVPGAAGAIEVDVNDPGAARRGIALIAHPNPVQGGTKDNKVVTTLAKAFFSLGYAAVRPNFRGVGASEGVHDHGNGEADDMVTVLKAIKSRLHTDAVVLAGFSFGGFVQTLVAQRVTPQQLVLVGPAVNRFPAATVAPNTLVVHGEQDDVVPLAAVLDWARPQHLPVVVIPGGEHFFHGRLGQLAAIVMHHCR